jgi:peptidoglycan/LPS O-acetylase OafA/YrhL
MIPATDPAAARAEIPRVAVLDGVRGLAILLVLLYHFSFYGGMRSELLVDRIFRVVTLAGWSGVDLFFVLSGFLITGILYDAKGGPAYFRNFYVRRVLRIFPLYYAVLVVCFVVLPTISAPDPAFRQLVDDQIWYWTYLTNVKFTISGWPQHLSLGHFWSLAVEEQFYFVWPAVVLLCGRRALVKTCLGCIGVAVLLRVFLYFSGNSMATYVLTVTRMDALTLGALLAVLARDPGGLARWRPHAIIAGWIAGAGLFAIAVAGKGLSLEDPWMQTIGYTLLAIVYGTLLTLVLTATEGSALRRVFSARALLVLGRYSYGLYVYHHLVIGEVRRSGFRASHHEVLGSQLPAQGLYVLVAFCITFAIAALSWHLFEEPILRLKNRFPYARAPVRAGAAAPAVGRGVSERTTGPGGEVEGLTVLGDVDRGTGPLRE